MAIKTNIDLFVARRQAGLKQWELAQRLGISQTMLCDLERGRKVVTEELADRILIALRPGKAMAKASSTLAMPEVARATSFPRRYTREQPGQVRAS